MMKAYINRKKQALKERAENAMMYRYAMYAKNPSVAKLIGGEATQKTKEDMRKEFDEAVKLMGADVIPLKRQVSK